MLCYPLTHKEILAHKIVLTHKKYSRIDQSQQALTTGSSYESVQGWRQVDGSPADRELFVSNGEL